MSELNTQGQTVEAWSNRIRLLQNALDLSENEQDKEAFRIRIDEIQGWIDKATK